MTGLRGVVLSGLWLMLAHALPASAATDAPRPQLLVLDLTAGNLDPAEVSLLDGLVVQALARHDELQVLSSRDIKQMVDIEAQKQVLGCDTESCLAEIAGAMGARYVVYGQVGKLGGIVLLQLNLFDSLEGKSVSREKVEADDLVALSRLVEPTADRLVARLTGVAVAHSEPAPPPSTQPGLHAGWLVVGAGGVTALAGLVGLGVGVTPLLAHAGLQGRLAELPATHDGLAEAKGLQSEADGWNRAWTAWGAPVLVIGAVGAAVGAALLVGGTAWATLEEDAS